MPSRTKLIFAAAILALAALIGVLALGSRGPGPGGSGEALVGGPFSLVDQTGRRVTEADFKGRFMLVFFGYSFCPDVCPTELQVMTHALETMGTSGERITPVFITIDPARDTPPVLKSYVENFSPRLVGLTGTDAEIAQVAKAFRVYYRKAGDTASPDYLMDHSSIIYLMGPDGRFVKHFTYTTDAKALAEALQEAVVSSP